MVKDLRVLAIQMDPLITICTSFIIATASGGSPGRSSCQSARSRADEQAARGRAADRSGQVLGPAGCGAAAGIVSA